MNATGLALDAEGHLYVSSRYDGTVHRVSPEGATSIYAEGMGIATGIAFDSQETCTWGIAAEPSSRLPRTGRFLSSPPSNPASRPIISPSDWMEPSLSRLRQPPALTRSMPSIRTASCACTIGAWGVRRDWPWTWRATSMYLRPCGAARHRLDHPGGRSIAGAGRLRYCRAGLRTRRERDHRDQQRSL